MSHAVATEPLPAWVPGDAPRQPEGRPSWSGLLQFSLVGIPLKAFPAVRTRDVPSLHQVHAACGQRIRYLKQCPAHGTVDAANIDRAFEVAPGEHVTVDPEELDQLRPSQDRALRLERFLAPQLCDPLCFSGRSLYLVPDGPAAEPAYAVLCQALQQRQRWALGRVVLGGHRQLVVVRPHESVLILLVLHYPEYVRACPRLGARPATGPDPHQEELRLAEQLIDAASGPVDWTAYPDQAAHELRALIDLKLQGRPAAAAAPPLHILPLVEALRQSLAACEDSNKGHDSRTRRPKASSRSRRKRSAG